MTDTLTFGVQYRAPGDTEPTVEILTDEAEITTKLTALWSRFGIVGKVVTRPAVDWTLDTKLTSTFARQVAEGIIADLSEGEITDERAEELLHPLGSGLLSINGVIMRTGQELPFAEECTYAGWLERAVNLHDTCVEVSRGLVSDPSEAIGKDYDNHIAVLAGLADHYPGGCQKCTVTAPAEKSEVAA